MLRIRRVSGEDAIRALERPGFVRIRQRGSHVVLKKDTGGREFGTVVPLHKELVLGTLRGILKLAGVEVQDFIDNL